MITAEEFERQYAANSNQTVEQLRAKGRIVAPCDCDYELCQGWKSVNGLYYAEDLKRHFTDGDIRP